MEIIGGYQNLHIHSAMYFFLNKKKGLLVGGHNGLILKNESLSTSIQEHNTIRNEDSFLNYPNPFHSRTIISYHLHESGHVELNIYDLSGRKLTTLLNESQLPNHHEIEWDASGMLPGIYLCELRTRHCSRVIKMILLD